jgi:DNA-binding NarL/FixJ family response regulator
MRTGRPGAIACPAHNAGGALPVTPRQLAAVRALVATGSRKGGAHELGISASTMRGNLQQARDRLGVQTTLQVVYALTVSGRLEVDDLRRE